MINHSLVTVHDTADIRKVIEVIDRNALQIALVVNQDLKLVGTVTDGDVRRGILRGIGMDQPVTLVMNRNPTVATPGQPPAEIRALMRRKGLRHIPIVDNQGKLVAIELHDRLPKLETKPNWVVIMAGGVGKRLGELTSETPKPMLTVKNKPLLGSIVENLSEFGFNRIFLSVNYKRNVIQNHFGDGSAYNVKIDYLEEKLPTGTAGSLSLLPEKPNAPFIVMNADLVTNLNFDALLDFHRREKASATMSIREHDVEIPFGVVKITDRNRVVTLEEKPKNRVFINAGIYVLEPKVLELIPEETYFDMTELLERLLQEKMPVAAFPIREQWIDIGRVEDFERANRE